MLNDDDMRKKDLDAVQREKVAVAKKLAALDRERATLEQQASELAITERTLARILGIALPENGHAVASAQKSGGKPKKIPSIHLMAQALFAEMGEQWLEGQEIVRLIRDRWWPSAQSNDIAPTLWRLQKTGKLRKDGTRYALPESEEPSTASR